MKRIWKDTNNEEDKQMKDKANAIDKDNNKIVMKDIKEINK